MSYDLLTLGCVPLRVEVCQRIRLLPSPRICEVTGQMEPPEFLQIFRPDSEDVVTAAVSELCKQRLAAGRHLN